MAARVQNAKPTWQARVNYNKLSLVSIYVHECGGVEAICCLAVDACKLRGIPALDLWNSHIRGEYAASLDPVVY